MKPASSFRSTHAFPSPLTREGAEKAKAKVHLSPLAREGEGGQGGEVLIALLMLLLGCSCSPPEQHESPTSPPSDAGLDSAIVDASDDADSGLITPDASIPGWHRWPFSPEGCSVFVSDDLSKIELLPWETCPFQPNGCMRAGAPWQQELGWGYGASVMAAASGGDVLLSVGRMAPDQWSETLLFKNDVLVGAWRWGPAGLCNAGMPQLYLGQAHLLILHVQALTSAWIFSASPEALSSNPGQPHFFGPPDSALFAEGLGVSTSKLALVREAGGRFSVRDIATGATQRPEPGSLAYLQLSDATPVDDRSYFTAITSGWMNSVWVHKFATGSQPLLKDDTNTYSYNHFVTDGVDAVWNRSSGYLPDQPPFGQLFQTTELWTSPIAAEGSFQPKMLLTLPVAGPPQLAVGEGWAAVRVGEQDTRLYRLSDGLEKRLPVVGNLAWSGEQFIGIAIAGGYVFVATCYVGGACNDVSFITRFEIDKLPTF